MISRISRLPNRGSAGRHITGYLLTVCLLVVSTAASAQEGRSPRHAKVISISPNVNELYIAIMGEVANPGTYHVAPTSLNLQSVVQLAGGLTSDASPTIRVVRQGRVTHKEVFSAQAHTGLFPGDLLVVDPRQAMARFSGNVEMAGEPTTIHASYQERAPGSAVQIALLNLVDYPMVLKLRPDDANAFNIVEKLGQPIELLANTYVITPDVFPRSSSEAAKRAIRLAESSVMVFDRERVNRNRLPTTLPKPIESEIALGAQAGLIGSPWGQSTELRNLGQQATSSDSESIDFSTQFRQRMTDESEQPSPAEIGEPINGRTGESPATVSTSKPRIANLPFTGVPRITNSSTGESHPESGTNESIPQPDDSADDPSSPPVPPSIAISEPTSATSSAFSKPQLLILVLIVGTLVATALMVRRLLESQPTDLHAIQTSIPERDSTASENSLIGQPIGAKSLLELLIKNELPVTMEAVEFPTGLTLQGRIAERPILRVDGSQSILKQHGPHFGSATRSSGGKSMRETIAQSDHAQVGSIRRPHFIETEPQKAASRSTTQDRHDVEAGNGDELLKAPLAKALFQLEQGDRS